MKRSSLTSLALVVAALSASLALAACNTVDGLGEDVSAGADAVSDAATENKRY